MAWILGPCLKGLGLYVLLCGASVLTGRGLIRLTRLKVEARAELLVASLLGFIFWSLCLGVAGGLRVPVRVLAPWLWGASALVSAAGVFRPLPALRSSLPPLLLCVAFPAVLMGHGFARGITEDAGRYAQDGWTYMAGGAWVWEHGRNQALALPSNIVALPLVQRVGAYFNNERYMSFMFLAYFSPLVRPGATHAVGGLYEAWTVFCTACAVLLFWVVERQRLWLAGVTTALTVLSGWLATPVWANNLDELLALACFPGLAAVLSCCSTDRWRYSALLGALLAVLWYAYPECAPFITLGALFAGLPRFWAERGSGVRWLLGGALALVLAAALLVPAAGTLCTFARAQYAGSMTWGLQHGYQMFHGLLDPRSYPAALWGLGGQSYAKAHTAVMNVVGAVLCLAAVVGLVGQLRTRRWGLTVASLLFLAAVFYFLCWNAYPYAASKLLTIGWWCLVGAVVAGGRCLLGMLPWRRMHGPLAGGVSAAGIALGLWACQIDKPLWPSRFAGLSATSFARVRHIKEIVGDRPVMIAVDDWLPSLLALSHSQGLHTYLASPRAWLVDPRVVAVARLDADLPPPDVEFVLTDDDPASWNSFVHYGRVVWSQKPYRLWKLDPLQTSALIVHVNNLHGLGRAPGGDFLWLAAHDTTFYVRAACPGALHLKAALAPGPGLAGSEDCPLEVRTDSGDETEPVVGAGGCDIGVSVHAGMNQIAIRPLPRTTTPGPGEDPFALLLKVTDLRAEFTPAATTAGTDERSSLPAAGGPDASDTGPIR